MFSCLQEKNEETVTNPIKEIEESENIKLENDFQVQEINNYDKLNIVSPDQLKIDGSQRYFYNDSLFTGISRQYQGDLITFEIQFLRGRKHGVSTFWHENGQKKSILTFKNGTAKGEFKVWDKSGNLVKEGVN